MFIEAAVVVATVIILPGAALVWLEHVERRRRSRWWRDYFHRGGLVRVLMQRWNGPKRLTHRPDDHT